MPRFIVRQLLHDSTSSLMPPWLLFFPCLGVQHPPPSPSSLIPSKEEPRTTATAIANEAHSTQQVPLGQYKETHPHPHSPPRLRLHSRIPRGYCQVGKRNERNKAQDQRLMRKESMTKSQRSTARVRENLWIRFHTLFPP